MTNWRVRSAGGRRRCLASSLAGIRSGGAPEAGEQAVAAIARLHQVTAGLSLPYPRTRMDSRRRMARFLAWIDERGVGPGETALATLAEQVEFYAAAFAERLAPHEKDLPHGVVHHDA